MRWAVLVVVALGAVPHVALAGVERFAVLVGNSVGDRDDQRLRYAEADAENLHDVLVDVGGVRPENVVMLEGATADTVRRALITVNDRIRALPEGTEAMLVVYYSGHADAIALHLASTRLELDELQRLVRGSAARIRILIVDACRSGSLTRVKGGRRVEPFAITLDDRLGSEGAVFLTSSAANEDAQESDELKGSFFTHYLASGLLGAADSNGDGQVTLAEAYRYAYDNTLRASSRTLAGIQHPTFRFDLAGRDDVVITKLADAERERAWLELPPDRAYLVLRDDANGAVIAEVGARDSHRRLSLRPGRYFVRGRGRDFLLEGTVELSAGSSHLLGDDELDRIEYARLVRKGSVLRHVEGPELGVTVHSAIANAATGCIGGSVGYRIEYATFAVGAALGWCRASSESTSLSASVDELALAVRVAKLWDVHWLALGPTIALGGGAFDQRFETTGTAPARVSAFGRIDAGVIAGAQLYGPIHAAIELGAATYLFRQDVHDDHVALSAALQAALIVSWGL